MFADGSGGPPERVFKSSQVQSGKKSKPTSGMDTKAGKPFPWEVVKRSPEGWPLNDYGERVRSDSWKPPHIMAELWTTWKHPRKMKEWNRYRENIQREYGVDVMDYRPPPKSPE